MKRFSLSIMMFLLAMSVSHAAFLGLSLSSYDTEIYKQETVNIPVIITAQNISNNVDVTITTETGLGTDTSTITYTDFSGASNEQGTVTFTLTGTQTGTYNPPFVSISAESGSTTATPLTTGASITVLERPTWSIDLSADDTSVSEGDQVTLELTVTPSGGSFEGVSADLTLPSGWTLVSGSDPKSIGTINGASVSTWIIEVGSSSGTVTVGVSATSPQESALDNTDSVSITVSSSNESGGSPGGSSGGSGGSGGGSGGGAITSPQTEIETDDSAQDVSGANSVPVSFSSNKKVTVIANVGDVLPLLLTKSVGEHKVTILEATESRVVLVFESEPQTVELYVDESAFVDLNNDDEFDVFVTYGGLTDSGILLTFEEVTRAVNEDETRALDSSQGILPKPEGTFLYVYIFVIALLVAGIIVLVRYLRNR